MFNETNIKKKQKKLVLTTIFKYGICGYGILHIETREKVLGKLLREIDNASPRASPVWVVF